MKRFSKFVVFLIVSLLLTSPLVAVFQFIPTVKAKNVYRFTHIDAEVINPVGNLVLYRWNREASLAVGLPSGVISNTEFEVLSDKEGVLFDGGVAKARIYKLDEESIEFDVVLEKNIGVYEFVFPISTKNLAFYYQPPLYEEYGFSEPFSNATFFVNATHVIENGIVTGYRPENVVGSYAVYHATKRDNEYKTGKAFHIYRPFAVDSVGKEVWCELNIDETKGLLTITISQTFLDSAVYPVSIDPTFGYTTAGGSSWMLGGNTLNGARPHPCSETGTAANMSWYGCSSSGSINLKCAIYRDSNDALIGYTEQLAVSTSVQWWTHNIISGGSLSAQDYILTLWANNGFTFYYDSVSGFYKAYRSLTYNSFPNPAGWTSKIANEKFKWSVYCTYTVAGGQSYTVDLTETISPSASLNKWQDQFKALTETILSSSQIVFGAEWKVSLSQTFVLSESLAYSQEQVYVFPQTVSPSASLLKWVDLMYNFPESISQLASLTPSGEGSYSYMETVYSSEAMNYLQEHLHSCGETIIFTLSMSYSIEQVQVFEYSFSFAQTVSPSGTIEYWIESIIIFSQTFSPTETITYRQEQFYPFQQSFTISEGMIQWQEHSHAYSETAYPSATTQPIGVETIFTFLHTITSSTTMNHWQDQFFSFSQTSILSTTINVFLDAMHMFAEILYPSTTSTSSGEGKFMLTQTITPSETISYWQEQSQTMTETIISTPSFQHAIEGIQEFAEIFIETMQSSTLMNFWMEISHQLVAGSAQTGISTNIAEAIFSLTQTIAPTESIVYWQEQAFIKTATMQPLTSLYYSSEGLLEFIESFTDTITISDILTIIIPTVTPGEAISLVYVAIGIAAVVTFSVAIAFFATKQED